MIVARLFVVPSFPSGTAQELARPNAVESPSQLVCHRAVIDIGAHTGPTKKPMLSGSSAVEIGGSYPKFSRVPAPGAVSFVLATSRFGMTARGATELTIFLLFVSKLHRIPAIQRVRLSKEGVAPAIFRAEISESRVPPCRRPARCGMHPVQNKRLKPLICAHRH